MRLKLANTIDYVSIMIGYLFHPYELCPWKDFHNQTLSL